MKKHCDLGMKETERVQSEKTHSGHRICTSRRGTEKTDQYTHTHRLLRKRKGNSEGETERLDGRAKSHGELSPGLESELPICFWLDFRVWKGR